MHAADQNDDVSLLTSASKGSCCCNSGSKDARQSIPAPRDTYDADDRAAHKFRCRPIQLVLSAPYLAALIDAYAST